MKTDSMIISISGYLNNYRLMTMMMIIIITIPNNKPDIIILDNEKGTCMLIDVAILGDRNVIKKEAEKILKHKDLTIEIQRMWNVKTKVRPVIIGRLGVFQSHSENT
jgi:hypothetical protein